MKKKRLSWLVSGFHSTMLTIGMCRLWRSSRETLEPHHRRPAPAFGQGMIEMSDAKKLTSGQQVWCLDGRRAEFLAETPLGIIVRMGFYRPGDPQDGGDEY